MGAQTRIQTSLVDRLAVEVAEEEKEIFCESLPQSLIVEADGKGIDCIAPFKQEEIVLGPRVSVCNFSIGSESKDSALFFYLTQRFVIPTPIIRSTQM